MKDKINNMLNNKNKLPDKMFNLFRKLEIISKIIKI